LAGYFRRIISAARDVAYRPLVKRRRPQDEESPPMPAVFINYRREESAGEARALYVAG
jgi:hypothetical protein